MLKLADIVRYRKAGFSFLMSVAYFNISITLISGCYDQVYTLKKQTKLQTTTKTDSQQIKLIASLEKRLKCCTHRNQVFVGFGKKKSNCYIGICRDRTGMDKQKYWPYGITQRPQR